MSTSAIDEIVGSCLAGRVRLISRAVTSVYESALERHGLTVAQVNLLAALGRIGPCMPSQLGDVLQLERSTVSRNLIPLVEQGWIAALSSDARGLREVAVTRAGRRKLESLLTDWRRAQDQATELLGASGVDAILGIAARIGALPEA